MRQRLHRVVVMMGAIALASILWLTASPTLAEPVPDAAMQATADSTGEQLFEIHCAGCHLNGGNIIRRGKNLKMRALRRNHMDSVEAIAHIVTYGKRPMSAYADKLTPDEIERVSAYVLTQAEHGW